MTENEFKSKVLFIGFTPAKRYDGSSYSNLWKIPNTTIFLQYIYKDADLIVVSVKNNEFESFQNWDKAISFLSAL